MILPSLTSLRNLSNKRVFVRVDFNVPLEKDGKKMRVANDWRIKKALPTLEFLLSRAARVVVATHLGRPGGENDAALSTKPAAERLAKLLDYPVKRSVESVKVIDQILWKNQKKGTVLF